MGVVAKDADKKKGNEKSQDPRPDCLVPCNEGLFQGQQGGPKGTKKKGGKVLHITGSGVTSFSRRNSRISSTSSSSRYISWGDWSKGSPGKSRVDSM